MTAPEQTDCRNRLLSMMSAQDFALLASDLKPVNLPKGFVLAEANRLTEQVYFLDASIGSIVATSPEGLECEAGLVGSDGMLPLSVLLGADASPHRIIVQVPDGGHSIGRLPFLQAFEASSTLRNLCLRFVQVMTVQAAFTALSNAVHPIDERLARWLLMCHDRTPSDEIPLTHEFMSIMLAVRRPSVTTALHALEGNGFIRCDRGYVTILNRVALEEFAGDAYGRPEAEYRRLIGPMN